jgi:monoamine oxidase
MQNTRADLLIIGAGLTGLSLAYYLRNSGLQITILEGRNRIGGRILTSKAEHSPTIEMGATWLMPSDRMLLKLLKELKLEVFEQRMNKHAIYDLASMPKAQLVELPSGQMPSYRIKGGTGTLINALEQKLSAQTTICQNELVKRISKEEAGIKVNTKGNLYHAKAVVSTLPPYLLQEQLEMTPTLAEDLQKLMQNTHTWMRDSIKFGMSYAQPFWREAGRTGIIFSNSGPIIECFDHSDAEDKHYALKGFLHPHFQQFTKEERLQLVLKQLQKYYGAIAKDYLAYEDLDWSQERFTTSSNIKGLVPHQNNGHALYQQAYWEGRLFIAGTETAKFRAGYMEGALHSAAWVAKQIEA